MKSIPSEGAKAFFLFHRPELSLLAKEVLASYYIPNYSIAFARLGELQQAASCCPFEFAFVNLQAVK
jgi:hypothetical protein